VASEKLTAQSAITTPVSTDILFLVSDPGGTPADKKITLANLAAAILTLPVQALAAAGNAQGNAGAVTAASGALIHGTGADGTKGIVLPAAAAGKAYFVKNSDAANAILKVYPASGDAINALAGDAAISMAAKTSAVFIAVDATTWFTFPLLPS
jgi:hypothetical protein